MERIVYIISFNPLAGLLTALLIIFTSRPEPLRDSEILVGDSPDLDGDSLYFVGDSLNLFGDYSSFIGFG